MKNFEKYEQEIKTHNNMIFAITNRKIANCADTYCSDCEFGSNPRECGEKRMNWLYEEYQEAPIDWSKVDVDTPILVSNDGEEWFKAHFAKYDEKERIFAWDFGSTSWTAEGNMRVWEFAKFPEKE